MKKLGTLALTVTLLAAGAANAAEVLEEVKVQTTGKSTGSMTGMMIGGVGGPIGALIGAGIGALFGGTAQETTGLSERAYKVRIADGHEKIVRSSEELVIGEEVDVRGRRAFRTSDMAVADKSTYRNAYSYRD
ncbi:hypothetical protein [Azotobacter beijerinckii]|uniref:Outer membrane lipoprotein SlyB n=1 Tax=Azotobacter beijerinckii TaxID=170623 RepID=A0A1I4BWU8_9GAMM|nr:hypothetical protein [Azotobacter beijerinckii]SFB40427.1 hypothetical protein SAMN04244571_02626 [Azotobacter beijerinckii]SFK72910.1 hypothetical protein SAMN04244574_01664 [Azotobacter beijerinckii]